MNSLSRTKKSFSTKIILFLMIMGVAAPFGLAMILVKKGSQNRTLSHHGHLISPLPNINQLDRQAFKGTQNLAPATLLGKWWLVYVAPEKCQETCHDVLYNMRQIRTALGKDASRLDRLFIAHPLCPTSVCDQYLQETYPDMKRISLSPADFTQLFGAISDNISRERVGELYIIDPHGNILMQYDSAVAARAILSDIKHLLKVSQIG